VPIIKSLLDIDFYKFTMGRLVFNWYREVPVKYTLQNRNSLVRLADYVQKRDLRRELDHVRTLRFNNSELHFLRGTNEYGDRMFPEEYLDFLRNLQLPEYDLEQVDGSYRLEFPGAWSEAIYWETLALAIISELYCRSLMSPLSDFERDIVYARGKLRLAEKIKALREKPDVTFVDFGTRRRFSREWQFYVDRTLSSELPSQFLGTSNTAAAMEYGLIPMGTSAHEMFMVMAGIMHGSDDEIRSSHNHVLQDWWHEYGPGLSIALTDNYGTDFFFRDMTEEQARTWKGLRHDSGNPFDFGEKALAFYRNHGIDPREKMLIFSDGLDLDAIVSLADHFAGKIKVSFGWGTNLTNDLGLEPLSLVIKVIDANGNPAVKLTDNLSKASGRPADIERYTSSFSEPCRY
jgi:nicotinate phosphoribosyltransferase